MRKFGIKIWSADVLKNPCFFQDCVAAVKEGKFDYIELFALTDSFETTGKLLKREIGSLPVIIHAPHSKFGLDTGNPDSYESNCKKLKDSQDFADMFNSEIIILHAGNGEGNKYLEESIRQFKMINDKRIAVENLPYMCTSTNKNLHGTSPEQIRMLKDETGCKFCLDFSHAVCAANHYKRDVWTDLEAYEKLEPDMYHLCDGLSDEVLDKHLHYGEGNYDLRRLLNNYTSKEAIITMETGHGTPIGVEPWLNDIAYIKKLEEL